MVVGETVGEMSGAVGGCDPAPAGSTSVTPTAPAAPHQPPPPNIHNIMGGMEGTAGVRLHNHRKKLKQRFDIVKKLGQGTYGKVQLGINKETGQEVAIKTIKKVKIETEADLIRIRREIQIMSSVQHPNIIHIYEVFENREKMVLVMEYAAGGELYDYLSERKVLAETEARRIFRQISTAVYYCHKHKICHRDLKLENILLDENGNAKIADFGLSNVFDETRLLSTFCGSPLYASPEIVRGTPYHGPEVDCWSLGVLLYTLVYGAMPFDGSNFKRLVKQISQGDYFEPKKPSPASPLIRAILTVNPRRRADIEAICSHWWVNEGYEGSGDGVPSCLEEAEELASRTPVRLDLLLSLVPPPAPGGGLVVGAEPAVPPADGTAPAVEAAVTGVQEMGNGDVVCQPVPPRSHSVGSFMDLEYHGTPSRMPPFVPPERRPKVGGRASEKEAPQKRKHEGGSASGVCVPKRIDEEGRKEEEEERLAAASMGVSGVLKEEEEEEVKAEEEVGAKEPIVPQTSPVPVATNEVELMEVDEVAVDESATNDKVVASDEPVKEDVGEVKTDERTIKEPMDKKESPHAEVVPESVQEEAVMEKQADVESVSLPESVKVEGEVVKPDEVEIKENKASSTDAGEEKTKVPKEEEEEDKKKQGEEKKAEDEDEKKKLKEDEEKKAAKALARKRLSLKIPKKAAAVTPAVPDVPVAPAGSSKVPEEKVSEVKQDSVTIPSKDAAKPVAPKTERRRSQAFERFNSLLAASSPSPDSPTADKPKKVFIPGIKVSDAKRAFEKKATNATAVIKVNNKPIPPSASSKIIPSPSQTKTDGVTPVIKNKVDESPKKDALPKPAKETSKEPAESLSPSSTVVNGTKENEEPIKPVAESEKPSVQVTEKPVKQEVNKKPVEKVAPEKSPVEEKAAKVRRPKDPDKSPSTVKKGSVKAKEPQEPVVSQTPPAEPEQVKSPDKPTENSMDATQESPLVENPPVWSKSATLPRRASQPKLRGVPVPFGQHIMNSAPLSRPKPQEQAPEQQPPQPSPVTPPQAPPASAPCQYSTAVEYTLKPELEGFPGELSFTISQGLPNSVTTSSIAQPPAEPAAPVRRIGRPITRHPTAPATFLRSSSLGPTPRPTGSTPSRGVERIIPIKVERDEDTETTNSFSRSTSLTTTEDMSSSATPSARPPLYPQGARFGPRGESLSRQSTQDSDSGDTATPGSQAPTPGPEPIRKSPREFIIPIAVEGGGYVTPRAGSLEPTGSEEKQNSADPWHQFHSRAGRMGLPKRMSSSMRSESGASEDEGVNVSSPPPSFNGNPFDDETMSTASAATTTPGVSRPFHMHRLRSSRPNRRLLEHSDSFSSAEEEDDDDGFEILTAESLFSTLLARVRSLTQRLNVDDGSGGGSGSGLSNRSSHLFPSASRLLSGAGLHHHGNTHHLGSLGNAGSSPLSGGSLFSTPSSFRSPHTQTTSSGLWPNLHNSRAGESLTRRLSESSRFSDPSRYSRSMSGGGISPGGYSSTSSASSSAPWRRTLNRDTSSLDGGGISGDKGVGSPGSWRGSESRGDDSPGGSGNPLGTFVARGSDTGEPEDNKRERLNERRANSRSSVSSRFTPSLAKRMQSQQDQSATSSLCPPLPPSSSSSSLSSSFSSSSHHQSHRASALPPAGKEATRNEGGGAPVNDNYCNSNMPNVPMSPTEEDLPPGFGRRTGRHTSWNDSERRPTSYYDGLKSDSERRDERMASLDALRKRREIPVSVRIRSSSLGRDRASILSEAVDPKRNDETLTARGTRNIIDLRSRSSSLTRDGKVVDPIERSRRSIGSMHENISNASDQTVLEKLLHRREKNETSSSAKEGRRRLSRGDIDMDIDESCRDCRAFSPRPQSLPVSPNMVQTWNGELKNERGSKEAVEAENSAKKKGRRISRFLRPDFFDTPREESVFAKKKEAEAAENALVENEKKQREQHLMGSFLHSLEKRLDKLRGGERSKKSNQPEGEQAVTLDEPVSVAQGCLTSTKLTAEVRKAKLAATDDSTNLDGSKKGIASSRVDRAINSLLQREKGKTKKEVSESGLIKRAVGIDERGCPSKSRSSGELARLSVTGGSFLGKSVGQTNMLPLGGENDVNGVGMENGVGAKFSNKVNAMLAMFRRNEVEHVPVSRTARLRRTQSVAYDKSVPDDILSAISGHDAMKNNDNTATNKSETESKTVQTENANKLVNKTEKVKKSSKSTKEKSSTKSKASTLKEKKLTSAKTEKTVEDTHKESTNEKLPNPYVSKKLADSVKDKSTTTSLEKKSDAMNIKNAKCLKNEITETATKPSSNSTSLSMNESNSLTCTPLHTNDRHASKSKVESLNNKSLDNGPVKLQINPPYESKKEIKELDNIESTRSANLKQLDRTATQDSLDSSWSACSDGLADMGGSVRERGKISRREGEGLGMIDYADPDAVRSNCIDSPSLAVMDDSGEKVSGKGELGVGDDDSEESVGDRIRRKSFYCRFNEVPSRRKSRVGRKSSASSLLYSDHSWSPLDLKPDHPQSKSLRRSSGSGRSSSSVSPASAMEGNSLDSSPVQLSNRTNTESKKPELTSNLSRDSFSPPPLPYKRSSAIYRRSSTSPYQERVPSTDPLLHSTPQTTGLRPTSSANSLARSNSSSRAASEVEDESRLTVSKRGEEGGHMTYIPSPLSPSSSMCNSYHNGLSPPVLDEVSLDQDRKSIRSRKLGVPSMADGITKPSPTHRKYNRYSSYCSSDGLTSSSVMKESGPLSPTTEHTSQRMHPVGLPPMGIPISNKLRTMRNSSGYE